MGQSRSGGLRVITGGRVTINSSGRQGYCPTPNYDPNVPPVEEQRAAITEADRRGRKFFMTSGLGRM